MEMFFIIRADIKSKKSTIISIFILLFLTCSFLTTVFSIIQNAGKRYEEASNHVNVPDITTVIEEDLIPENFQAKLEEDPSIDYVKVVPKIYINNFKVKDKLFEEIQGIGVYSPSEHPYEIYSKNTLGIIDNNQLVPKPGEIFIPIGSKTRYKCELGDTITYMLNKKEKSFTISAFIEEPYSGCALMGMKRVFVNEQDFEFIKNLFNSNQMEIEVYFTDNNTDKSNTVLKRISEQENFSELGTYTLTQQDSKMFTMIFINILSGILLAFSFLLFIIILIITGFSINMSINMDYADYGILKSLGFTAAKIKIIILLQYLISGGLGCLLGFGVSSLGVTFMSRFFIPITGLYVSNQPAIFSGSILLICMLIFMTVFILLLTRKINKIYPIHAINGYLTKSNKNSILKFNISKYQRIPLVLRLVIKKVIEQSRQHIGMILILALLLFFLMTTASIKQLKNYDNVSSMFGGSSGEIQITFTNTIDFDLVNQIENSILGITPVLNIFKSDIQYFSVDGLQYMGNIVDNGSILKQPLQGREPENNNEIIVTEVLSGILEKGIGDTVSISNGSMRAEYKITGINQDTSDVGKCFGILEKGIQRLDSSYKINKIDISIKDKSKSGEVITQLNNHFKEQIGEIEIYNQYQNILDQSEFIIIAVNSITTLIYIIALFFTGIIVFINCSKSFIMETTDMGIAKSLGFSTKDLRGQFTIRFFIISVVGSLIGLMTYLIVGKKLLELLFGGIGMGHIAMSLTINDFIIPISFVCFTSVLFAWLTSSKINKVSPKNLINL